MKPGRKRISESLPLLGGFGGPQTLAAGTGDTHVLLTLTVDVSKRSEGFGANAKPRDVT